MRVDTYEFSELTQEMNMHFYSFGQSFSETALQLLDVATIALC